MRVRLGCPAKVQTGEGSLKMATYESLVGTASGRWSRGLCAFFETCGGCKAFIMACNWPFCGPCLFAKIASRVRWAGTQTFGDTPYKQWFRVSLLLVCIYWLASWGASLAAPQPRFDLVKDGLLDVSAIDQTASLDLANATGDADVASEAKAINSDIEGTVDRIDMDVPGFGVDAETYPAFRPLESFFQTVKWIAGVVWLVMVILLRAHTRREFTIPATCCSCKVSGPVDFEDILCSFCCQPCTLSQMATHTDAVGNEHTCDCCDMEDPGPCQASLEAPDSSLGTAAPAVNNSMDKGGHV